MPRQYLQINDFSGGINTKSDQRDIENNELTVVTSMQLYNAGQIKLIMILQAILNL